MRPDKDFGFAAPRLLIPTKRTGERVEFFANVLQMCGAYVSQHCYEYYKERYGPVARFAV
jgi:hypothetical protein